MANTIRSRKQKGKRLQNEIAERLREEFNLDETDCHSSVSCENGIDVRLSADGLSKIPYSIECKCQESIQIWKAIQQSETNKLPNTDSVLIFKRNRSKTYAVIELDTFIKLIKK